MSRNGGPCPSPRPAGAALAQAWSLEESWQKLDQAIHAAVQVRTGTNELPLHAEVTLQTMIREWDPVRQTQALNDTLRELGLLRLRIAQEYVGLVQDYSQAIEAYLQQRDRGASSSPFEASGPQRASRPPSSNWTRWMPGGWLCGLRRRRVPGSPSPAPAPQAQVP